MPEQHKSKNEDHQDNGGVHDQENQPPGRHFVFNQTIGRNALHQGRIDLHIAHVLDSLTNQLLICSE